MKKLFILSFASILLLTGCGATETLSCSYQTNANNGTTEVKYDIDHQNDEVKKVRITYNYDFNNDTNGATDNNATTRNTDTDGNNNARIGGNNTAGATNGTNDNTGTDVTTGTTNGNGNNTNNNGISGYNNENNNNENDDITVYNNGTTNNNGTNGNNNNNNQIDGVGTGTDGTTNDSQIDDDGVVDGVIGSAIDTIVGGVTDIILDSAGLRDRHSTVQNTYGNITGFSVQNTNDDNDNYTVTYVIDYDTISDDDLATFNLSRDLDELRDNYVNQGFTCK